MGKTLPQLPLSNRSPKEVSIIPFSSGTTGLPKGVMLSDENLVSNLEMLLKTAGGEFFTKTGTKFFLTNNHFVIFTFYYLGI